MVGSAMAMDLQRQEDFDVTVADVRLDVLERLRDRYGVFTQTADLSDPAEVRRLAGEYDLVLGALSSHLGLATLQAMVDANKPYVDISFMPENPLALDSEAKRAGVVAVVDCGVAPGMSNMIAGHAAAVLDPCERIEIYVGGLPEQRRWPWQYKAGFAPADVLEEYVRPARMVEHGQEVVRPALSRVELIDFPRIGTLEAFETDGLRSLVHTLDVPTMLEKTMRYPGHAELMRVLRAAGFFSQEPIEVAGQKVVPLEVTSALLFPQWKFEEGEADITVMRVVAIGTRDGQRVRMQWDLFDRYDPQTGFRSMSRATAFPATIVAGLVARGRFTKPGVHAPEVLGQEPGLLDEVLQALAERGVTYESSTTPL